MSELENNPEASVPAADPETKSEELRRLVNILFAGLILTSFTLTAFLGLQYKRAAEEADQAKKQAEELTRVIQQEDANIQITYAKLTEFARRHPDFQNQVLFKYKITTNAPAK